MKYNEINISIVFVLLSTMTTSMTYNPWNIILIFRFFLLFLLYFSASRETYRITKSTLSTERYNCLVWFSNLQQQYQNIWNNKQQWILKRVLSSLNFFYIFCLLHSFNMTYAVFIQWNEWNLRVNFDCRQSDEFNANYNFAMILYYTNTVVSLLISIAMHQRHDIKFIFEKKKFFLGSNIFEDFNSFVIWLHTIWNIFKNSDWNESDLNSIKRLENAKIIEIFEFQSYWAFHFDCMLSHASFIDFAIHLFTYLFPYLSLSRILFVYLFHSIHTLKYNIMIFSKYFSF